MTNMTRATLRLVLMLTIFVGGLTFASHANADSGDHWCRQGDPPILASKHTSCDMAAAIINRWVALNGPLEDPFKVKSPVTKKTYNIRCYLKEYGGRADCKGPRGIRTRFSSDI